MNIKEITLEEGEPYVDRVKKFSDEYGLARRTYFRIKRGVNWGWH